MVSKHIVSSCLTKVVTRGSWIQHIQELACHKVSETVSEVLNSCLGNEKVDLVSELDIEAGQKLTTDNLTQLS